MLHPNHGQGLQFRISRARASTAEVNILGMFVSFMTARIEGIYSTYIYFMKYICINIYIYTVEYRRKEVVCTYSVQTVNSSLYKLAFINGRWYIHVFMYEYILFIYRVSCHTIEG